MTVNEKLAKLHAYALSAKTSIINEDAMTAIELAAATACKVNECVDAINLLIEVIEGMGTALGLDYDAETETIII